MRRVVVFPTFSAALAASRCVSGSSQTQQSLGVTLGEKLRQQYARLAEMPQMDQYVPYSRSQLLPAAEREVAVAALVATEDGVASQDQQQSTPEEHSDDELLAMVAARPRQLHGHFLRWNAADKAVYLTRFGYWDTPATQGSEHEAAWRRYLALRDSTDNNEASGDVRIHRQILDDGVAKSSIRLKLPQVAQLLFALNGCSLRPVPREPGEGAEEMKRRLGDPAARREVNVSGDTFDLKASWVPQELPGAIPVFTLSGTMWNDAFTLEHCWSRERDAVDRERVRYAPLLQKAGGYEGDGLDAPLRGATTTDLDELITTTSVGDGSGKRRPLTDPEKLMVFKAPRWDVPAIEFSDPANVVELRQFLERAITAAFAEQPASRPPRR